MASAVLVVEDETVIRKNICKHLEDRGLIVFQADDASCAIGMMMDYPQIVLVFANISMHGQINGRDLVLWLKLNRPRTIIMISISNAEPVRVQALQDLPVGFTFRKPYHLKAVGDIILKVLDRSQ